MLGSHNVAVGVTFDEETNWDDEPWHDPGTGHVWARSDPSKKLESLRQRLSGTRRGRTRSRRSHGDARSPALLLTTATVVLVAARESVAMAHPRSPVRALVARDRGGGTGGDRASDDRPRSFTRQSPRVPSLLPRNGRNLRPPTRAQCFVVWQGNCYHSSSCKYTQTSSAAPAPRHLSTIRGNR